MPRVTSKRIQTTSLQGEGSYIVIKPVSWATAKKINEYLGVGNVALRDDMSDEQKKKHIAEETALTEQCLLTSIVEWNWSDENNKPLPVPRKTEDLDLLTTDEIGFLVRVTTGIQDTDAKNSESGPSTTSGLEAATTLPQTSG